MALGHPLIALNQTRYIGKYGMQPDKEVRTDWNKEAQRLLKFELTIRQISYKDLAKLLEGIGVAETERSIASKISRGSFSFAFFLQCMRAIGAREVDVSGKPVTSVKKEP